MSASTDRSFLSTSAPYSSAVDKLKSKEKVAFISLNLLYQELTEESMEGRKRKRRNQL